MVQYRPADLVALARGRPGGAAQRAGARHIHPSADTADADGRPRLEGFGTREETIALWREVTGISTDDIEWYEDFTRLKIACLSIRTFTLKGLAPPDDATLARRMRIDWPG